MIAFKDIRHIEQWTLVHSKLRELIGWVDLIWPHETLVITRLTDDAPNQKTIMHRLGRAADVRITNTPEWLRYTLLSEIIAEWYYGDEGAHQVVVYERDPDHFHFQVRDETGRT